MKKISRFQVGRITCALLLFAAIMLPLQLLAQSRQVSGTVKNDRGESLPGVIVREKGTSSGAASNETGKFTVNVTGANPTLIFSFIGYNTLEVPVNGRATIDVTLQVSEKTLDQVVVVGYGTMRKSDITGSISSVSAKDIKATPAASLSQALAGRAAGVKVSQSSNAPGGGMTIRIRGGNSIQGGNEPLYVIDGYPLYNESGPTLNPNDIESMEILKDASATAIYGSRGANGVIIITTKRGKAGRNNINFESYYGVQKVRKKLDMLDATQFAKLINEGIANNNADNLAANPNYTPKPLAFTDAQIAALGKGTDWQDAIFRDAPMQNYQLTFSGGNDKTQYAVSGSYFGQEGIVINSGFGRGTIRMNLDQQVSDRFKISTSMTGAFSRGRSVNTDGDGGGNAGVVYGALIFSPTVPIYNADGSYTMNNRPGGILISNPVALAMETTNKTTTSRFLGNVTGEYKIIEGLTIKTLLGATINYGKNNFYQTRNVYAGAANNGRASINATQYGEWLNENTLNFNRTFNKIHKVYATVGYTFQTANFETVTANAQNFSNDILKENNIGTAQQTNIGASGKNDWALRSYIARVNYGFRDKYLVTLTGRVDGSSRFGAGNKNAFFPSGSLAWRLSKEPFMQSIETIDDLKIRASYGLTGNQEIGQYQSLGSLSVQNYNFGNVLSVGYAPNRIGNPNLKWETTAQLDFGFDLSMFNSRVEVTVDVYQKDTRDLLYNISLPITSGYFTSLQNVGKVRNQGLEFSLNTTNVTGKFQWNTNFNIAFNRNEIMDLGNVKGDIPSGQASGHLQLGNSGILRVGSPIGVFFGYKTDGIFQNADEIKNSAQKNAKPGDRRFVDVTGDGVISTADRVILGKAQPDFTYGFTNNFSYKGFDLSVFFQGVQGNSIFNLNRFEQESMTGVANQSTAVLDRWTPTNPSKTIPRANSSGQPYQITDRQVEDGSYLRLRNIQLGYNLPEKWLKRVNMTSVKIYVSGQNLATWTKYSGFDPEVSRFGQDNLSMGTDYGSYPAAKIYLVGLNIGL
ncbi:TonB-linked SusC/RagA family outer membrane protein [Chitinophaga skermanii]|uniref:TonB-linked SusC/RagA family outer membrane protein n=1 Tax=Chitinophaga skermanii TaxID=331697 RepID=A0A327R5Z8_9BACT|nr:TonB-dependent receptor [Chitinophaga skermanii]RAJ11114.1 TonB-linked SusC/RagA family outer membrane protein [Chitinophaga skermanii]